MMMKDSVPVIELMKSAGKHKRKSQVYEHFNRVPASGNRTPARGTQCEKTEWKHLTGMIIIEIKEYAKKNIRKQRT
jgi:hypothetical protein